IDLTPWSGKIEAGDVESPTTLYVKLRSGLNVIDFETDGNDLAVTNSNIIVDGPADALGIFRVPWGSKLDLNQSNILIGSSGIQRCNVIFFSDWPEQSAVFDFDDTLFYGISFWTLGDGSGSDVDNSQGCVQFIGDKLNFQDIRYCRCCEGTVEVIPEPSTLALLGLGAVPLLLRYRRRKDRGQ
ncbi:MAG: PEP-CTERM sorting domain-containing protein, partial [Candidatus Brocadiaceae bacterium]